MSGNARLTLLKREHASEKRLGSVQTLYIAGRLYVPPAATAVHQAYLSSVHDPVCANPVDMIERLRDRVKVCWDSMSSDAMRYFKSCGRCQHVAAGTHPAPVGRMNQFLYPAPNHTLLMDFYGYLPSCKRASPLDPTCAEHEYLYIITLVDAYSRYAIFLPSTHKSAAAAIAAYRHWISFYGRVATVRTDSDQAFLSFAFQAALSEFGSVHDPVPPHTHHALGLLERVHGPLGAALRKLGGHAVTEWIDLLPLIMAWRNSCVNRSLGVSPYEALFGRKPTFAYDRLGLDTVLTVTPNELANLSAALEVCVRTAAAVASAQVAAQFDGARLDPPSYSVGDTVLIYFPDRENKSHTFYRGPFTVLSRADERGNYYIVKDLIQFNEYEVHVERMKSFDMSRTTLTEQAARQLPSRDFGIVVGVDGHRMNEAQGLYELCIRFYSGHRAWQLYPYVEKLDVVRQYVLEHTLNTRKQTPSQQYTRLTGKRASTTPPISVRPTPRRTTTPAARNSAATPVPTTPAARNSASTPVPSALAASPAAHSPATHTVSLAPTTLASPLRRSSRR